MSPQKTAGLPDTLKQSALDRAHELINVKYHHQGRNPEAGLDCVGFVLEVYKVLGREFDLPLDYSSVPRPKTLLTNLARYCDIVETPEPLDIILMIPRKMPQHLALYVGDGQIIHSYGLIGKVTKHELNGQYKIHSIHRLK